MNNDELPDPSPGGEGLPEKPVNENDIQSLNNDDTENMEVHYHPHLGHGHKKKIKEYLSEFLMIFLAVSLGFIAENLRERITENHKAQEYIHGFIKDLEEDTTALNETLRLNRRVISGLDSITNLAASDMSLTENRRLLYHLTSRYFGNFSDFMVHDVTMQQVKYAGDLHILSKQNVADSLVTYYASIAHDLTQQQTNTELFKDLINVEEELFDFHILYDQSYLTFGSIKPVPPFTDPIKLRAFFNKVIIYESVLSFYDQNIENWSMKSAKNLIKFLKKTYHLEED